jgi:DNA-binding transcriptional LysR family regulator
MRLRQLEYFVAIADAGSYAAASRDLYVAQPSLSQQIKGLEEELGGALFERTPQGIRLTAGGKVFLADARALLHLANRAKRTVRAIFDGAAAELVVAGVRSIASGVLPAAVSAWGLDHPDAILDLRDFNHRRLVEAAVTSGQADVGVGPRPATWPGRLRSLGFEEIVLISSRDLSAESLTDMPWVVYEAEHGFSEVMERFHQQHGIVPKIVARSPQVEAAMSYAITGLGVTLVPANIVPESSEHLMRKCSPRLFREVTAFSTDEANPLIEQFMALLTKVNLPVVNLRDLPSDATVI